MHETFQGGIFSDTLADGRAGAQLQLLPSGIAAQTPDGEAFVIPYRECQVEVGGFSGRVVFCRNQDRSLTIFCEDSKFPPALSLASAGLLDGQLAIGRRLRRSESRRELSVGSLLLLGLVLLLIAGYFGIRAGANAAVLALPLSVDKQIGDAAMQSMDLGGAKIDDPVVLDALQSIVDRMQPVAANAEIDFRVHVVDAPTVNAFALPGGNMVVYTGLIQTAGSAEQIAAVLAHEMSHATLRHGLQRLGQSLGIYAALTLLVGDVSGLMGAGVDLFQAASINSYSRTHENEADAEGLRMLHAAKIDPSGMAEFFAIMEENHDDLPGIFAWVSTHPDPASRIANVEAQVAGLPPQEYQPIEVDWPLVKQRVQSHRDEKRPDRK